MAALLTSFNQLNSANALIKNMYDPDRLAEGFCGFSKTIDLLTKGRAQDLAWNADGNIEKLYLAFRKAINGAGGQVSSTHYLPAGAYDDETFEMTVKAGTLNQVVTIDEDTRTSVNTPDKLQNLIKTLTDQQLLAMATSLNRQIHGANERYLATVTGAQANADDYAASNLTYTFAVNTVNIGPQGMVFDIYDSTLTTRRATAAVLKGANRKFGPGTIKIKGRAAISGIVAGDVLVPCNSVENSTATQIIPWRNQIDNKGTWPSSNVTGAVDRGTTVDTVSEYAGFRSFVIDCNGNENVTNASIIDLVDAMCSALGWAQKKTKMIQDTQNRKAMIEKEISFLMCGDSIKRELARAARDMVRLGETNLSDVNISVMTFDTIPILVEPFLDNNGTAEGESSGSEIIALDMDAMGVMWTKPYYLPANIGYFQRQTTTDLWEAVLRCKYQNVVVEPQRCGAIRNYVTQHAKNPYSYVKGL